MAHDPKKLHASQVSLALIAAAVTAATLIVAGTTWTNIADHFKTPHTDIPLGMTMSMSLGLWLLCVAVAAVPTLVVGLPVFLILASTGLVRWWSSALAGALIGILTFVSLNRISFGFIDISPWQYSGAAEFAATGAVSALAAWLVWLASQRSPDVA